MKVVNVRKLVKIRQNLTRFLYKDFSYTRIIIVIIIFSKEVKFVFLLHSHFSAFTNTFVESNN